MAAQLGEGDDPVDRRAVLHDMEIVGREIDDPRAVEPVDMGSPDVPFLGYGPIEITVPGSGDFADVEGICCRRPVGFAEFPLR